MLNTKRFILSSVAAFAGIFIYDMLVHGHLLMSMYTETASLWRTPEEMENYFAWCLVGKAAMALVLTWIFTRHYENRGLNEGVRFGLYIGLVLGIDMAMSYVHMPIPAMLALAWFVAGVVKGILVGVIVSLTYRE